MKNHKFVFEPAQSPGEDSEYFLEVDGKRTAFGIQVGGCDETAGYYYLNEYGPDDDFWVRPLGEFRSLAKAKAAAIKAAGL